MWTSHSWKVMWFTQGLSWPVSTIISASGSLPNALSTAKTRTEYSFCRMMWSTSREPTKPPAPVMVHARSNSGISPLQRVVARVEEAVGLRPLDAGGVVVAVPHVLGRLDPAQVDLRLVDRDLLVGPLAATDVACPGVDHFHWGPTLQPNALARLLIRALVAAGFFARPIALMAFATSPQFAIGKPPCGR